MAANNNISNTFTRCFRFAFAAHQRPTEVEVRVGGSAASLRVSDEWAQAVDVDLASAAANAEAAFRPP